MSDYWTKNDSIFVCDGIGYVVAPTGATGNIGKYPPVEMSQAALQHQPVNGDAVSIMEIEGNIPQALTAPSIMKHKKGRGRPVKTSGALSRTTMWRREKQLALNIKS